MWNTAKSLLQYTPMPFHLTHDQVKNTSQLLKYKVFILSSWLASLSPTFAAEQDLEKSTLSEVLSFELQQKQVTYTGKILVLKP